MHLHAKMLGRARKSFYLNLAICIHSGINTERQKWTLVMTSFIVKCLYTFLFRVRFEVQLYSSLSLFSNRDLQVWRKSEVSQPCNTQSR
jgi:hypothetical protein